MLDKVLAEMATFYEAEVDRGLKRLTVLLEPVLNDVSSLSAWPYPVLVAQCHEYIQLGWVGSRRASLSLS